VKDDGTGEEGCQEAETKVSDEQLSHGENPRRLKISE
jgi:hypothetical protein